MPRCHFLFLRLILFGKLWNYIIEDMRTETIALINEGSLGLDFKPVMTRVLKGVLVAASVWITASVVSKEEAMNPEQEKALAWKQPEKASDGIPESAVK